MFKEKHSVCVPKVKKNSANISQVPVINIFYLMFCYSAIEIFMLDQKKYLFTSFLYRDKAFEEIASKVVKNIYIYHALFIYLFVIIKER